MFNVDFGIFGKRKHQIRFIREQRNISGFRSIAWPILARTQPCAADLPIDHNKAFTDFGRIGVGRDIVSYNVGIYHLPLVIWGMVNYCFTVLHTLIGIFMYIYRYIYIYIFNYMYIHI